MRINHLIWGHPYSQTNPLVTVATISRKLAGVIDGLDVQESVYGGPHFNGDPQSSPWVNLY